ncbi:MAG: hypothetical protein KDD33_03525 [Bdellovibrionales bacterium]|nr:hypothetical protein [Bdellovibrionales bacterium]
MSFGYWFKLAALALAFSITLLCIYWLRDGHLSQALNSLGVQGQGQVLNWCDQRVHSLVYIPSGAKIMEDNSQWKWTIPGSESVLLDYLSIEKWFAKYCHLPAEPIREEATGMATPLLEVEFITSERFVFYEMENGFIRARGQVFKAPTLREAIKELLAFGPKIQ